MVPSPDDQALLVVLHRAADAVGAALAGLDDWSLAGTRPGQYRSDLAADRASLAVLEGAGLGVVSEESGAHHPGRDVVVVIDPVDGSSNASRGIPWFATSLCALDDDGPRAAVVVNQALGTRFEAIRGGGSRRDGRPISVSGCTSLAAAMIGLSGFPPRPLGWYQYRALGAAALDLCAVACGILDGYADFSANAQGPWDYLGGLLVCQEAGGVVAEAQGRDLLTRRHEDRRAPVAAATPALLEELLAGRASFF